MGNTTANKEISINEMKSYLIESGIPSLNVEVSTDEQIKTLIERTCLRCKAGKCNL